MPTSLCNLAVLCLSVVNFLARILITSGPTRQFIDPVRYLTNASSGRMGKALAEAALALGHDVVIVSGPVEVEYPPSAAVVPVVSTEEMLTAAGQEFENCDGLIGAAAPSDYRPMRVESHKIAKTGQPIDLHLIETDDVVATLGARKGKRWVVGFALETEDHRLRALAKLEREVSQQAAKHITECEPHRYCCLKYSQRGRPSQGREVISDQCRGNSGIRRFTHSHQRSDQAERNGPAREFHSKMSYRQVKV